MIIGIDVGGSTTKIVGVKDGEIKASDVCDCQGPCHFVVWCIREIYIRPFHPAFGGGAGNADRSGKFIHSAALVRSAYGPYG